jgi:hypothetical protein
MTALRLTPPSCLATSEALRPAAHNVFTRQSAACWRVTLPLSNEADFPRLSASRDRIERVRSRPAPTGDVSRVVV